MKALSLRLDLELIAPELRKLLGPSGDKGLRREYPRQLSVQGISFGTLFECRALCAFAFELRLFSSCCFWRASSIWPLAAISLTCSARAVSSRLRCSVSICASRVWICVNVWSCSSGIVTVWACVGLSYVGRSNAGSRAVE